MFYTLIEFIPNGCMLILFRITTPHDTLRCNDVSALSKLWRTLFTMVFRVKKNAQMRAHSRLT